MRGDGGHPTRRSETCRGHCDVLPQSCPRGPFGVSVRCVWVMPISWGSVAPSFFLSINTILEFLPKQRRTGLFSATQTQEVESLVRAGLRNPVRISVKEKGATASSSQKTPSRLQNHYMVSSGVGGAPSAGHQRQQAATGVPGQHSAALGLTVLSQVLDAC